MPQAPLKKTAAAAPAAAGKARARAAAASGGGAAAQLRAQRKGRTAVAPKSAQQQAAAKLQKRLTAGIHRNIEETLAARASQVKSLRVLQPVADSGTRKLAADPKAGRSGRAVKGVAKKK